MDPKHAFIVFVQKVVLAEKAERFTALAASKSGQNKILDGLCHQFASAIRPAAIHKGGYDRHWASPCYVYYQPLGFGAEFSSVCEAYDQLSAEDSWLILLRDGSLGIYRPEGR